MSTTQWRERKDMLQVRHLNSL